VPSRSRNWTELAYRGEPAGGRVVRTVYELCLFRVLRERLRCKEIWVGPRGTTERDPSVASTAPSQLLETAGLPKLTHGAR
jgi:hypothetical protein